MPYGMRRKWNPTGLRIAAVIGGRPGPSQVRVRSFAEIGRNLQGNSVSISAGAPPGNAVPEPILSPTGDPQFAPCISTNFYPWRSRDGKGTSK